METITPRLTLLLTLTLTLTLIFIASNRYESFISYMRCPEKKVSGLVKEIFDKNSVTKNTTDNWDLYIPCGYNGVEREIATIATYNNKQKIFGIDGCDKIVSKNSLWTLLDQEYGREQASKIMPETYVLSNATDMKEFEKNYDASNIYIMKKNIQRKKGIELTSDYYKIINAKYEKYRIVQEFKESYLVNNRKFNLRYYLLIVCRDNHTYVYLHKYNKILYTSKTVADSKDNRMDFASNITNSYDVPNNIYQSHPYNLTELCKLVSADKLDNDINDLFKLFSRAIVLPLNNIVSIKDNSKFQLFGIDIIVARDMKPYILEINKGPDMKPKDDRDKKMKLKVLNDMFSKMEIIDPEDDYNLFEEIYTI
jgi:hypothetical protein